MLKKFIKYTGTSLLVGVIAVGIIGCKDKSTASKSADQVTQILGAGSSFVYPSMSRWANEYYEKTNIQVNYQPIGSGGGQRQIFAHTVNFAASDQPLTNSILKKHDLIQFPIIIGGIVPVVNIKGISVNQLTLSGPVLAKIYLGEIKKWNAPEIQKLNPDLKLPNMPIITIHRADGSGTTYNFSNYLAKVDKTWEQKVGVSTTLNWPGTAIGAKGNAGVAAQVQQLSNSIGYVEYAYAKEGHLTTIKMLNADGKAVAPNPASFEGAAKNAQWSKENNFYLILTNQPGVNSWPIAASTFILLPKNNPKNMNASILKFLSWTYSSKGNEIAKKLDYIGLPNNSVDMIKQYWQAKLGMI